MRAEAADSLIAARLVDAMVTEMDQLYAQSPGRGVGSGASPSDFSPPTGAFLVIYAHGKPVAGKAEAADQDRAWTFAPKGCWADGEYTLRADPVLVHDCPHTAA